MTVNDKNIYRVDTQTNATHAWMVIVRRKKHAVQRMFSDGVHGGKGKALAAAKAWHAEQVSPLTEFEHQMWVRTIKRRNNRSAIVGVSRVVRSDSGIATWMASWTDETGRNRTRKFSTRLWGERTAKRMAIDERQRQLLKMVTLRSGVGAERSHGGGSE